MMDFDLPSLPDKYVAFGLGVLAGVALTVVTAFMWANWGT